MNERLKSIVDLEKYPIYDLNSPTIKNLIKRCKEELNQFSCSTIPNFILPKSLKIMNSELEKQLDEVYMSKESINPYLYAEDNQKLPKDHPKSTFMNRKNGKLNWLKPDGKTQVTIEYNQNNEPVKIAKVVIATQHKDMLDEFNNEKEEHEFISKQIAKEVILPVLSKSNVEYDNNFIINGTGRFVEGGPVADVGLTGRKIIVDTYGGYAKHGGGAFSGKDPSKVDRSAAYMARYVAKNVVAANLATKCEVQLSYCIGVAIPISINVNTFNTGKFSDSDIASAINKVFDFRPAEIIKHLDLKRPIYKELASYGHFGRGEKYTWEKTDKADKLMEILL